MEGEVTRVVAPASKTGEGLARGQGSNPTSSAVSRLSRDVAQERSACSGNTRPQVRFLSSRRRWCGPIVLRYRTVNSLELGTSSTHPLFMPSLRGTRHDSAKIDGGGSNPPGGTHAGRGCSVTNLETWRLPKRRQSSELHFLPAIYVEVWRPDRTPNPIGLGSIPRRRAIRPRFGAGRRVA